MRKINFLALILLFALTCSSYSQLAVGYQTDGNTLSVSTNPLNKIWGELRVNTKDYNQAGWSYSDKGITQAYLMLKLFSSKNTTLFTGGGIGVNSLSKGNDQWVSINIPVGLRMNPFASLPDFYLIGEYNPMIIVAGGTPVIHSVALGFRYVLGNKK
jgi:hypothetical protein